MNTILVVDDEKKVRDLYCKLFRGEGFKVLEAASARDAKTLLDNENIDIMLLDINMPAIDGSVLYGIVNLFCREVKVIVSSVYPVAYQRERIPGAVDYFDKALGLNILLDKVYRASLLEGYNEPVSEVN